MMNAFDRTKNVMLCAIWYHLHNLKNVKKTKVTGFSHNFTKSNFTKSNTSHGHLSRFLSCTNGTKSRKASQTNSFTSILTEFCLDFKEFISLLFQILRPPILQKAF